MFLRQKGVLLVIVFSFYHKLIVFRITFHNYTKELHCVKCARIQSYSGPHFPEFGLNTER